MESQPWGSQQKGRTRMRKVQLVVTVEIPDDAAVLLDATYMGGTAGLTVNTVQNLLNNAGLFKRASVDVAETPESDGEETEAAPAVQTPRSAHKPVSVPRAVSPVESGRTGRPKTLHNLAASDGGPVREWGQRSPEALAEAGVQVWEAQDDAPAGSAAKSPAVHVQQNSKRVPAAAVPHKVKVRNR